MATLQHSESRNLYSWWWDSHNTPKNSKWLQDNLRDMDVKVKTMIKLIEEDADSFARRAEMFYKKRPELMKLVEEIYRAYRALAERYDYTTGELRHAHKTIAAAFPDEVPFVLIDDVPSSLDPQSQSETFPNWSLHSSEESDVCVTRKGLKQLNEKLQSDVAVSHDSKLAEEEKLKKDMEELEKERILAKNFSQLSNDNENLKNRILFESERVAKAEMELQNLKDALTRTEVERDAVLLQYQLSLEKLSHLDKAFILAQKDAVEFKDRTCKAESEVKILEEKLLQLEEEKEANLCQYRGSLDQVVSLETRISSSRDDARRLNERVVKAETESKVLKEELVRSQADKEATCLMYEQCLDKISAMENKISAAEECAKMLSELNVRTNREVDNLKEKLLKLIEEKDDAALRYDHCLQKMSTLQNELTEAQKEAKLLNDEILLGSAKLRGAKEQCALLEKVNQSLQLEATTLVQKIAVEEHELSQKEAELEKLQSQLQDEQSQFSQVEATLRTFQNLQSRSQEHRALAMELRRGIQMLKDLEMGKQDLEMEVNCSKGENESLNYLSLSSSISEQNIQIEIKGSKAVNEKLESEVGRQGEKTVILERQLHHLKEAMGNLYEIYQDLIQQVEYAALEPSCLVSSVKVLQEENSWLKGSCRKDGSETDFFLQRLDHVEQLLKQCPLILESSLLNISGDLERSKEKAKVLQDSSLLQSGEKTALVAEKSALLSQLQIMIENMQKILERNGVLENSLPGENAELEGLRAKSKSLEEYCHLLHSERSKLFDERNSLISQLKAVELKLENMERRYACLKDKYADLKKEKQSTLYRVEELQASLGVEKQERASLMLNNEARLSALKDHVHRLQEDYRCRKDGFQVHLDNAVKAQIEDFILQRFMQDMEEKNYFFSVECQKQIEEAKYMEKLITELENKSMMYKVEMKVLLDKIAKLRTGIYQVLKALEINHVTEAEMGQNFMPSILSNIKELKCCVSESKDENQQLVIQNSILTTLCRQLNSEGTELSSRYDDLSQDYFILTLQHVVLKNEKHKLLEARQCLEFELTEREKQEEKLKVEMENLQIEQGVRQIAYAALQEDLLRKIEGNKVLLKKLSVLKEGKDNLEEVINKVLVEAVDFSIQAVIFKNWGMEKALEPNTVSQDMDHTFEAYNSLDIKDGELVAELEMMGLENLYLRECVEEFERMQHELSGHSSQLNQHVSVQQELLNQKELELSKMYSELKSVHDKNTELNRAVKAMESDCQYLKAAGYILEEKMLELSEHRNFQDQVIKGLQVANQNLEEKVGLLKKEIEECKAREEILSLELQERNSELEIREAEAAPFYYDFQICVIREVFFQNMLQELSGTCQDLEAVNSRKNMENEWMKERLRILENEVDGLRMQLAAYVPVIASLKNNMAPLDQNPALRRKLHLYGRTGEQVPVERSYSHLRGSCGKDDLLELQKLQSRIKLVENILVEEWERVGMQEPSNASTRLKASMKGMQDLTLRRNGHPEKYSIKGKLENEDPLLDNLLSPESVHEAGPETSESQTGTVIMHAQQDQTSCCSSYHYSRRHNGPSGDQMLWLCDSVEDYAHHIKIGKSQGQASLSEDILYHEFEIGDEHSLNPASHLHTEKELGVDWLELSRNVSYANQDIMERLASDANRLIGLQVSVQELKTKMETNKKSNSDMEYNRLRDQLLKVENSVIQLVDTNTELMKSVEDRPSASDTVALLELDDAEKAYIKRVSKQAQRGSEKIGRLQLELQKIQLVLLKLDGEKSRTGKSRFSRSRTGIMGYFVFRHGRSRRQKKSRFCGCLRPSAKEN